jgi:hypothetical protein
MFAAEKLLLTLSLISLSGCVQSQAPKTNTSVPFRLEDLKPYGQKGTGKITGEAMVRAPDGDFSTAYGETIELWPVTPFSKDVIRLRSSGVVVANDTDDVENQMKAYVRKCVGGFLGEFEFTDLPPGEYLLTVDISWENYNEHGPQKGRTPISEHVTIGKGETKEVHLYGYVPRS